MIFLLQVHLHVCAQSSVFFNSSKIAGPAASRPPLHRSQIVTDIVGGGLVKRHTRALLPEFSGNGRGHGRAALGGRREIRTCRVSAYRGPPYLTGGAADKLQVPGETSRQLPRVVQQRQQQKRLSKGSYHQTSWIRVAVIKAKSSSWLSSAWGNPHPQGVRIQRDTSSSQGKKALIHPRHVLVSGVGGGDTQGHSQSLQFSERPVCQRWASVAAGPPQLQSPPACCSARRRANPFLQRPYPHGQRGLGDVAAPPHGMVPCAPLPQNVSIPRLVLPSPKI